MTSLFCNNTRKFHEPLFITVHLIVRNEYSTPPIISEFLLFEPLGLSEKVILFPNFSIYYSQPSEYLDYPKYKHLSQVNRIMGIIL